MRQAWINNLRDLLSEITSSALHYYVAGFEDRTDQEYQHLTHLEYKIKLMLIRARMTIYGLSDSSRK